MLNSFLNATPREYGIWTRLEEVQSEGIRQLIIEQPRGTGC